MMSYLQGGGADNDTADIEISFDQDTDDSLELEELPP